LFAWDRDILHSGYLVIEGASSVTYREGFVVVGHVVVGGWDGSLKYYAVPMLWCRIIGSEIGGGKTI
jgi:hypothetical protein